MSYYEGKMSLFASNSCMQIYMLYKSVFLKLQKVQSKTLMNGIADVSV